MVVLNLVVKLHGTAHIHRPSTVRLRLVPTRSHFQLHCHFPTPGARWRSRGPPRPSVVSSAVYLFFFSRRLISSSSSSIFLTQRAVVENIAPYLRLTLADICACEIHVLKVLVGDSGVCDASDFSHSLTLALSAWLFFRGWFREREKKLPDHYLPFHSM